MRKLLFYMLLFFMGCVKNNTNEKENLLNTIEVITSDCDQKPFYYNLLNNTEDTTNWHISLQKIESGTYDMPSIILNTNMQITIYNTVAFNDIITIPDNLEWLSDTSLTSYGNEYEVLHYKYTCTNGEHTHQFEHKIMVMQHNYLLKEILTNNIYKLNFEDYDSGVVLFKYAQLN